MKKMMVTMTNPTPDDRDAQRRTTTNVAHNLVSLTDVLINSHLTKRVN